MQSTEDQLPKSKYVSIDRLPKCPFYHPLSELNSKSGCYPNITEDQLKSANETLECIKTEQLNFNSDNELEFLKVLRFLRARKFNVTQAMIMIRADVKWRSEENRLMLRQQTALEILDCDLSMVYKYFPTWIQGYDKQSRPVSWRQFGKFEIWNILKITSMKQLINFHAWESEQLLRLMDEKYIETGHNIETFTIVIDAAGWSVSHATSDAFTFVKGMANTDSGSYPERLGTLIVINAPTLLSWAYKVIQGFMDDVQKAKIRIFGTNADEWRPILFSIIDKDQVPVQYGGTLPDLAPEDALSSMDPPKQERETVEVTHTDTITLTVTDTVNTTDIDTDAVTETVSHIDIDVEDGVEDSIHDMQIDSENKDKDKKEAAKEMIEEEKEENGEDEDKIKDEDKVEDKEKGKDKDVLKVRQEFKTKIVLPGAKNNQIIKVRKIGKKINKEMNERRVEEKEEEDENELINVVLNKNENNGNKGNNYNYSVEDCNRGSRLSQSNELNFNQINFENNITDCDESKNEIETEIFEKKIQKPNENNQKNNQNRFDYNNVDNNIINTGRYSLIKPEEKEEKRDEEEKREEDKEERSSGERRRRVSQGNLSSSNKHSINNLNSIINDEMRRNNGSNNLTNEKNHLKKCDENYDNAGNKNDKNHGNDDEIISLCDGTFLTVSPLRSPMRLVSPTKERWNVDAWTQTELSNSEKLRNYKRERRKNRDRNSQPVVCTECDVCLIA